MLHRTAPLPLPMYCLARSIARRAVALGLLFAAGLIAAFTLSGQLPAGLLCGLGTLLTGVVVVARSSWQRHRYLWERG